MMIDQVFQIALQHHQAGQLSQAEQLYRQILAQQPNHVESLHNLGLISSQLGRNDIAVSLLRQAIILNPNHPLACNNLGNALRNLGHLDDAIAAYRQAIALRPDYPQAYSNLGSCLRNKGQLDDAIAAHRQVILLNPNIPEAYNNLGNALRGKNQLDEAITAYRQAVALRPNYADAHNNLGTTLGDKGCLDEAIAAYRQAILFNPEFSEAFSNLSNALKNKGQLDEAIAAARQAIALKPNYPPAHYNLGNALGEKDQLDEAIAAYRQAIVLNPHYFEACNNLGNRLKDQGQLDEAITTFRQAIASQPKYSDAHSNLLYTIHFHPDYDARKIAEEHRRWNHQHADPLRRFIQSSNNDRSPDRRLRIGYVSPDFREHPIGRFMLPLLANHDKASIEVFAYSNSPRADSTTERLRSHTDCWRSIVGVSDADAADLIRQDKIDILVDLTMHMADNRLLIFARKPAPVQVTYLAYCSTTGLKTIDYRLSDSYLDPPEADESIYSERTIRLPETYWCYQPIIATPQINPLPTSDQVTFGSLNNFCKDSEQTLKTWAKLLQVVPKSQLLIHAHEGSHRKWFSDRLKQDGIEPERVQFVGVVPTVKYFELYAGIDIALDPFPYGGGTTTCDALWMGVPVVSLAGNTGVGRGGLSILSNIGLPELVARSEEEYVQIASNLARDLPRLHNLRSTLRSRLEKSALMDAPRFARNIESAYRQMWRAWCGI